MIYTAHLPFYGRYSTIFVFNPPTHNTISTIIRAYTGSLCTDGQYCKNSISSADIIIIADLIIDTSLVQCASSIDL